MEHVSIATEPWAVFYRIIGILLMVGGAVGFIFGTLMLMQEVRRAFSDLLSHSSRKNGRDA